MKRIKSFVVFICGIVLLALGAVILLWRGFDIVTWIMMMLPPILRFFLDTQTSAIAAAAIYGVLAFGMLLKSALLIFYERNM